MQRLLAKGSGSVRVGVVAYEMEGESTGVGRYLRGLLGGVAEVDPGWRWTLFFHGPSRDEPLLSRPGFAAIFAGRTGRPLAWEQLRLPRALARWGGDLVFSPSYSLPPTAGLPGVLTVHDLSFELLGAEFGWRERWRRRWLARRACRRAARVLTDTEAMRQQLADRYRLPREKVAVVAPGVDRAFREAGAVTAGQAPRRGAETRLPGVRRPYLLHLGTLLDRRHPRLLLEAFASLRRRRPELSLVLAGADRLRRRGELEGWLADPELGAGVVRLGYVPEAAVVPLYQGALLSFYLSSYEGFGLPPLESLACGTPAVVGGGLALDELWPDYPFRVERLEATEVARVAAAALDEPLARRRVAEAGVERMGRLTWRRAAEAFLAELERALGR
jgi:glycosyltransferase involved in cell wall biosynthesis